MNLESFSILKQAFKSQKFDEKELKDIKRHVDPIIAEHIDYVTQNVDKIVGLDYKKFLTIKNTLEYKDEVVITFLLFIGKYINFEKLSHTFVKPFSDSIYYWLSLYKCVIYVIISLMYNKKFTVNDMLLLDQTILMFNEGHPDAIRQFMISIQVLKTNKPFEAEINYIHNRKLSADQYGPFYWRTLHFMAEAYDLRSGFNEEKKLWKEFVLYALHRTLRCSICSDHYKKMVNKYRKELNESNCYSKVWFDLHNDVNIEVGKQPYSEKEFDDDKTIMQKLLS